MKNKPKKFKKIVEGDKSFIVYGITSLILGLMFMISEIKLLNIFSGLIFGMGIVFFITYFHDRNVYWEEEE